MLSKVFRSTAKQPTQEAGSIRCGSSSQFKIIIRTSADFSGNNAVEHFVKVFNNDMLEVLNKHAPSQTKEIVLGPISPWYSEELRVAKHERRKAERV